MRMYALLVSERLLLKSGNVNHLLSLITKQSIIYRYSESFHRCLQLQMHAYRLVVQRQHTGWNKAEFEKKKLGSLVSLLFEILDKEMSIPVESLMLIWTWILNTADKTLSRIFFQLLFIITYVSYYLIGRH